jgi:hypothetical protein
MKHTTTLCRDAACIAVLVLLGLLYVGACWPIPALATAAAIAGGPVAIVLVILLERDEMQRPR